MPARIELLFNKFMEGSCTQQEFNELMDLLRENQQEEKVRQLLHQVYQSTARGLKSVTYVDDKGHLQTTTEEVATAAITPVRPIRRSVRGLAVAASLALLLGAGAWWALDSRQAAGPSAAAPAQPTVHKTTHPGEMKYLVLPDGTKVWLNVASTLDFPGSFNGSQREVYLNGEAFFDVRHAEKTPFIIHTGNVVTRVLGTAFNIRAYPGQPDVVVSVKRGKVQVSKNDQVMATLEKGQEVKVDNAAQEASIVPTRESTVAGWTSGTLSYDSRPVTDILNDLERNYNVVIEVNDESLKGEILTTSFRKDIGVEDALKIICKAVDRKLGYENGIYLIQQK